MSDYYTAARMLKPGYFRIARLLRGRGERPTVVIGFDSEQDTSDATCMLLQFSQTGERDDVTLLPIPVTKRAALSAFIDYVDEHTRDKRNDYVIVGFNLQYEWTQLFSDLPIDPESGVPIGACDEFVINYEHERPNGEREDYTITVTNNARYFATILRNKAHRRVKIVDAMAFYPGGLDAVAAMLDLPRKAELESKKFTRADMANALFLEYARQDAYITRRVGEAIVSMHEDYDTPQTLTAPHFASCVFRHHFLNAEIPLPNPDLEQAGLYAYHGGKNGYYLNKPRHMAHVYAFDITSAYPEAMRQLPDPELSEWHYVTQYEPGVHALWQVTMNYRQCKYRAIMEHGNRWLETGTHTVWTTSYELDGALARGEATITDCVGWIMRGPEGGALVRYVDRFFDMKRTATGAARVAAKLFLNSLYGKFFQKQPLGTVGWYDLSGDFGDMEHVEYVRTDPTQNFDYQVGGLYHPPIAALITGFVRAKIHRLEHKYGALMTSTDGFFAVRAPDPADVGTDLGALTVERGDLSIWRERLYAFVPDVAKHDAACKPDCGQDHPKFALHGFRGNLAALRRIPLAVGQYTYDAQQVITNKLSIRALRGTVYRAGTFVTLPFTLDLRAPP